jgi:hypothetical protein
MTRVIHYDSFRFMEGAVKQLTLRGFDKALERRIKSLARMEGISLNKAALRLLRRGAGLDPEGKPDVIGHSLDRFIGTWSKKEAEDFDKAVEVFEQVDGEMRR